MKEQIKNKKPNILLFKWMMHDLLTSVLSQNLRCGRQQVRNIFQVSWKLSIELRKCETGMGETMVEGVIGSFIIPVVCGSELLRAPSFLPVQSEYVIKEKNLLSSLRKESQQILMEGSTQLHSSSLIHMDGPFSALTDHN